VRARRGGYTLVEVLVATALVLLVVGGTLGVYIGVLRSWRGIDCRLDADRAANLALSRMVYGMHGRPGLRAAASASVRSDEDGWTLDYATVGTPAQSNAFTYSEGDGTLTFSPGGIVVARGVTFASAGVEGRAVCVTVRVDRVDGEFHARREIGTCVQRRN
jgi:type II secretory pathway pseudopilin PulG